MKAALLDILCGVLAIVLLPVLVVAAIICCLTVPRSDDGYWAGDS